MSSVARLGSSLSCRARPPLRYQAPGWAAVSRARRRRYASSRRSLTIQAWRAFGSSPARWSATRSIRDLML